MRPRPLHRLLLLAPLLLLCGCTLLGPQAKTGSRNLVITEGKAVWQVEYAFVPPPEPWRLIDLDEDDVSLAYFRGCDESDPAHYPCESTLAYAEEPFGYSRDLEKRQQEFFRRFLWAARVNFEEPRLRRVQVLDTEGLEATIEGFEPVLRHKVWAKILFTFRGERVVAFYMTQWRPEEAEYDRSVEKDFDTFVGSFSFLRPSFFQTL